MSLEGLDYLTERLVLLANWILSAFLRQENLWAIFDRLCFSLLTFLFIIFVSFFVQHAQRLYRHVFLACKEENNGPQHYKALFSLLAVLSVELASEEVLVDLIRLILALQVRTTHLEIILVTALLFSIS